jgi:hypothetical protein
MIDWFSYWAVVIFLFVMGGFLIWLGGLFKRINSTTQEMPHYVRESSDRRVWDVDENGVVYQVKGVDSTNFQNQNKPDDVVLW